MEGLHPVTLVDWLSLPLILLALAGTIWAIAGAQKKGKYPFRSPPIFVKMMFYAR